MIDFIPLVDYTPFFNYSILILVLIAFGNVIRVLHYIKT